MGASDGDWPRHHDLGGQENHDSIDRTHHELDDWELSIDAIENALEANNKIFSDELRRSIEGIPRDEYKALSYYERWIVAIELLLIERDWTTSGELSERLSEETRSWGPP